MVLFIYFKKKNWTFLLKRVSTKILVGWSYLKKGVVNDTPVWSETNKNSFLCLNFGEK